MLADPEVRERYDLIGEIEKITTRMSHNLDHVQSATDKAIRVAEMLVPFSAELNGGNFVRVDNGMLNTIKIAGLLHDVGIYDEENGTARKNDHGKRSHKWVKGYLQDKNVDDGTKESILEAVLNHSEGSDKLVGKIIAFADKMDVRRERVFVTPTAKDDKDRWQYRNILDTDFSVKKGVLIVNYSTDGKLDKSSFAQNNIQKKQVSLTESLANHFGLEYCFLMDGEMWLGAELGLSDKKFDFPLQIR